MAFAIQRPETAFTSPGRQRQPRNKAGSHLAFIRSLPCAIPGCASRDIHAAHIRAAARIHSKRAVGIGEKPDDSWTVPLCSDHHLFGEDAQHSENELAFWARHGIDPFTLALALWRVSGDEEAALLIIRETREQAIP